MTNNDDLIQQAWEDVKKAVERAYQEQAQKLYIYNTPITQMPYMAHLRSLRELYFFSNQLEDFPEGLYGIIQLEKISLANNKLIEVPESLGELENLEWLDLSANQITTLPTSITNLKKLKKLNLDGNPLNPELAVAYEHGLDSVMEYLTAVSNSRNSLHKRKLKIFLCHASQDKSIVYHLQRKLLSEEWIDPWLDTQKLLPGQDWQAEIKNAVKTADNVIIFLSNTSVNKDGYVQKELRFALDIAQEKAEGSVFLIPLRLDGCQVPQSLQLFQWADYFGVEKEQTYRKLLESLKLRLEDIKRKEMHMK